MVSGKDGSFVDRLGEALHGMANRGNQTRRAQFVDRGLKEGHFRALAEGQIEVPSDPDLQPSSWSGRKALSLILR